MSWKRTDSTPRHDRSKIKSDARLRTAFDYCNELDFLIRCFRNAYFRALLGKTAIRGDCTSQEETHRSWNRLLNRMFHILVAEGLVDPYVEGEEEEGNNDLADHSG